MNFIKGDNILSEMKFVKVTVLIPSRISTFSLTLRVFWVLEREKRVFWVSTVFLTYQMEVKGFALNQVCTISLRIRSDRAIKYSFCKSFAAFQS